MEQARKVAMSFFCETLDKQKLDELKKQKPDEDKKKKDRERNSQNRRR